MAPVLDVCHSQGGSSMTQLLQTLESVLGSKNCNYTAVSYAVSFVIDGCDMNDHNSEVGSVVAYGLMVLIIFWLCRYT